MIVSPSTMLPQHLDGGRNCSRIIHSFAGYRRHGLSHEAVAEELAMSQAAVRQAKSRVLRRLREQLGEAS